MANHSFSDISTKHEFPLKEFQQEGNISFIAKTNFPTTFGKFTLLGFEDLKEKTEFTVILRGKVNGSLDCPVRVHSECHTGDIFGSLRCDCRGQLEQSLRYIAKNDKGIIIYLRQEGRGIGLLNKIKAYSLQDQGIDTVEANKKLGLPPDSRNYKIAADVIKMLEIKSIHILTNNPEKIAGLKNQGITVTKNIPVLIPSNPYNEKYLATKKNKLNHML